MKLLTFSLRNEKEILRDPLNLGFGLGFPLVLLLLMSTIQKNVPVEIFEINRLSPGIAVFGLSFLTLFSATLISKDRSSSFLQRLYTTPLSPADFIFGYTLPLLPVALGQTLICYVAAMLFGLRPGVDLLFALLLMLPVTLFFIGFGLFCGSIFNDKQVGGICGALLTNLTGWLSGAWFDLDLVGGAFKTIARILPFYHATELQRGAITGNFEGAMTHVAVISAWSAAVLILSIVAFLRQMKRQ